MKTRLLDGLLVFVAIYIGIGVVMLIIKDLNYGTYFFDNGYHINRIGKILFTDRSLHYLGEGHFQPILIVHAILFLILGDFIGPGELLLGIQISTIFAGVYMVWKFLSVFITDPIHRKTYFAVFLISPPFWFAFLGDYHIETFLFVLVPLSLILLHKQRHVLFIATLFVYCTLKEVYPFIAAGLCLTACICYWKDRRLKQIYVLFLLIFIIVAWLEIEYMTIPLVNQYETTNSSIHSDFRHLGSSLSDVFKQLPLLPKVFIDFFNMGKLLYLVKVLIPWGVIIPFFSPLVFPAIPGLFLALFSSNPHHYSYAYQYAACVFPFVFCAYCDKVRLWRGGLFPAWALITTCAFHLAFSPAPLGRVYRIAEGSPFHHSAYDAASDYESLRRFIRLASTLPKDALYFVQNSFYIPAMVFDRDTLVFSGAEVRPLKNRAIYYLLCENRPHYMLDTVDSALYNEKLALLKSTSKTIFAAGGLYIFYLPPI